MKPSEESIKNPMLKIFSGVEGLSSVAPIPESTKKKNSPKKSHDIDKIKTNKPSWGTNSMQVPESEINAHGADALLNYIEKEEDEVETKTRERAPTVYDELMNKQISVKMSRNRKQSVDYSETMGAFEKNNVSYFAEFHKFLDFMKPKFRKRVNAYTFAFMFMCLILITRNFDQVGSAFLLYVAFIVLDVVTTIVDELFFICIVDRIFVDHYDTAYLLHGLNGPLGLILMLVLVQLYSSNLSADQIFPSYKSFISGLSIILLCLCVKNFYIRKHYISLLERRFADRLFKLETYTILLSELSTAMPPKRFCMEQNLNNLMSNRTERTEKSTDSADQMRGSLTAHYLEPILHGLHGAFTDLVNATQQYNDDDSLATSPSAITLSQKGTCPGGADSQGVPAGGVSASVPHKRVLFMGMSGPKEDTAAPPSLVKAKSNSFFHLSQRSKRSEKTEEEAKEDELADIRKRKTFWQSAAKLSANAGTLRISTYNGIVFIRKRSQAKDFGKTLYKHLSKKGKIVVTPKMLEALLYDAHHPIKKNESDFGGFAANNAEEEEDGNGDIEMGGVTGGGRTAAVGGPLSSPGGRVKDTSYTPLHLRIPSSIPPDSPSKRRVETTVEEDEHDKLLNDTAKELFDPFKSEVVTEDAIINALLLIYKEQRFAASSLNDYGEIHQSLHNVISFIFWAVMTIILQIFLKLDAMQYILPFVTMLLTVSFALGPLIGNVFLACTFVFFMIPYDIGNKVVIGVTNDKITGYIRGVSLLYTTLNTSTNQLMKIPNHLLFHEKICNLVESNGVVFQIDVAFNIMNYHAHPPVSGSSSLSVSPGESCDDLLLRSGSQSEGHTPTENGQTPSVAPSIATVTSSKLALPTASGSNQAKIDHLVELVKHFILVDHKEDWASCSMNCSAIDTINNSMTYSLYATHRDNYQDVKKANLAKTALILHIRELQLSMDLVFVKMSQPVSITFGGIGGGGGGGQQMSAEGMSQLANAFASMNSGQMMHSNQRSRNNSGKSNKKTSFSATDVTINSDSIRNRHLPVAPPPTNPFTDHVVLGPGSESRTASNSASEEDDEEVLTPISEGDEESPAFKTKMR